MKKISGNKLLVKALKEEGVDTIFGYPGACTIDISDELYKQDYTKVILPRQEVALVHEADAYARSTGKVGVCLVTSGPGATNLVTGLATAYYDSVPLVCFTGQVARHLIGNDAFQEVDIVGITRSMTKYVVTSVSYTHLLDPLFIFVFNWGIQGAAAATVIGQFVSGMLVIVYFLKFQKMKITRKLLIPKLCYLKLIASLGLASFIHQIALAVVQIVMNNTLRYYGAAVSYTHLDGAGSERRTLRR